ncbi:ribbon-helix-helix domain-containing protein [Pseudodesulfovibrio senegalensis]|jgi:predicted DNA-binding ribbon-helix-helix protein|uniref:Aryl-sulfate sulfotransferase n=1 Tax=Pseudodesulfovibrio senegalensis TaxID=1721087 RepID=A0A6N6N298_9BACT|nr:ribbon-helix-helix domain-containing protein [Pseudodesulfovibrio senegalensis]KAB1442071.1 aryl-sulfate sulfotransferase [Pseudodesulfovibrio senegalensis]
MCRLYLSAPVEQYRSQTRSVRINGVVTSIRLEARFWDILGRLAEAEGMTLGRLLSLLHEEALAAYGKIDNFASLLRVVCTTYQAVSAETRPDRHRMAEGNADARFRGRFRADLDARPASGHVSPSTNAKEADNVRRYGKNAGRKEL